MIRIIKECSHSAVQLLNASVHPPPYLLLDGGQYFGKSARNTENSLHFLQKKTARSFCVYQLLRTFLIYSQLIVLIAAKKPLS